LSAIVWDRGEKSYRRAVVTDVRERKRLQVRFGDKMAETRLDGGPSALTTKSTLLRMKTAISCRTTKNGILLMSSSI